MLAVSVTGMTPNPSAEEAFQVVFPSETLPLFGVQDMAEISELCSHVSALPHTLLQITEHVFSWLQRRYTHE